MKLGIMQPYFLPYLGYWQLMNAVDVYVVYDNIEYTKKGWINRNRFLQNGKDAYFTVPLKKDSDYLDIKERYVSDDFDRKKLLNQIRAAYQKAPFFEDIFPFFEKILNYGGKNLFDFLYNSILSVRETLAIKSNLIISSSLEIDSSLKGKDKILAICKTLGATEYYNAIGGQELYDKKEFADNGIQLYFVKPCLAPYTQFKNEFISGLSILDVLMFNPVERVREMLRDFELV